MFFSYITPSSHDNKRLLVCASPHVFLCISLFVACFRVGQRTYSFKIIIPASRNNAHFHFSQ